MASWDDATPLRRVDDGLYEVVLDSAYVVGRHAGIHGGYLIATLLRAVLDASPHATPVASSAHFLRVATPGPAEVRLEVLKLGRTVARTRATVFQNGAPVMTALVTTGVLDAHGEPIWTVKPPKSPPMDECIAPDPSHPLNPGRPFLDRLDMRLDPATAGWLDGRPAGMPEIRAYFPMRDDRPDPGSLALVIDAIPPVTYGIGRYIIKTTVDWALHMRAEPSPGWLLVSARGRLVSGGWFDEDIDVWDSAGRLVAQSHQLARATEPPARPAPGTTSPPD